MVEVVDGSFGVLSLDYEAIGFASFAKIERALSALPKIYGAKEPEPVSERKRASTKASVSSSTAATGPNRRSSCKRAKDFSALKVIVVTWGWEDPIPTLRTAARLSKKMDAELHVAHVWSLLPRGALEFVDSAHYETQEEDARQALGAQVRTVEAAGGIVAKTHLRLGVPEREAAELGEEVGADMMIVGSRGLGFIERLLSGGEAERIARRAPCSVLVVRQECPELPAL